MAAIPTAGSYCLFILVGIYSALIAQEFLFKTCINLRWNCIFALALCASFFHWKLLWRLDYETAGFFVEESPAGGEKLFHYPSCLLKKQYI